MKPALCLALIGGKLSLVGPPAAVRGAGGRVRGRPRAGAAGHNGPMEVVPARIEKQALEEEALGLESWSLERDIMILMESIGMLVIGRRIRDGSSAREMRREADI